MSFDERVRITFELSHELRTESDNLIPRGMRNDILCKMLSLVLDFIKEHGWEGIGLLMNGRYKLEKVD